MRLFLTAAFLFIGFLAFGQGFNKRYDAFGNGFYQQAFNIERVDGGYVIIGGTEDYDTIATGSYFFHASVILEWIDEMGVKQDEKKAWRALHNTTGGWSNCCDTIPGGGFVVGGASEDSLGNDEVYLMRFNAMGDTLWTKVFGGPSLDYYYIGRQVKSTHDGGFLIVGDMGINIGIQGINAFAIKTDSSGTEQWRQIYSWPPPRSEGFLSSALSLNGSFYLAGSTYPTDDNGQYWVVRIDSLGNEMWNVDWGPSPFTEGLSEVITSTSGDAIVFGNRAYALSNSATRPYIAKLDSENGAILWEREYGEILENHVLLSGKECPNSDLIVAGFSFPSPGVHEGIMLRTTATGDSLWMFSYFYQDSIMDNGRGQFFDVIPTLDGGFIAAGVCRNPVGLPYPPGYSQDTWVVKVDGNGCIVPGCNTVGITEQATNLQDALTLFPNPVASGQPLTMQLDLLHSVANQPLQLSVVSLDGRVVHQQNLVGNGAHTLALQPLAAGVYYVHVAAGSKWLTGGKFVVE